MWLCLHCGNEIFPFNSVEDHELVELWFIIPIEGDFLSSVIKWQRWNNQHDTRVGQRKKIWVSDGNRTHDLLYTGRVLYPLSHENSWRARPLNWVHVRHSSCILLGQSNVWHCCSMFDIADPSIMQDTCQTWTQFDGLALHELSWLSG